MVHHIPRFLAVERNRRKLAKIALLVLDGLALDQWLLLRRSLETTPNQWRFEEMTAFAWVPTLTCVTRQSIFAGEPPLYFPESFDTTAKEKAHWVRYWEDQGVSRGCADLIPNLEACDDPRLDAVLANPRLSVLAIVWNKVDEIMHGMQMETSGMHNQVRLWASQGHLQQLLLRLHAEGFHVFLTADHGNVRPSCFRTKLANRRKRPSLNARSRKLSHSPLVVAFRPLRWSTWSGTPASRLRANCVRTSRNARTAVTSS